MNNNLILINNVLTRIWPDDMVEILLISRSVKFLKKGLVFIRSKRLSVKMDPGTYKIPYIGVSYNIGSYPSCFIEISVEKEILYLCIIYFSFKPLLLH